MRGHLVVRGHGWVLSAFSCASVAAISSNEGACQSWLYPSQELAAKAEPSGEKRATFPAELIVASVRISCAVSIFQNLARLSPQLARVFSSGENDRLLIPATWPRRIPSFCPVFTSQR